MKKQVIAEKIQKLLKNGQSDRFRTCGINVQKR